MNLLLARPVENTRSDAFHPITDTLTNDYKQQTPDENYETEAMPIRQLHPLAQGVDEEEAYRLFEKAISTRITALHTRQQRLGGALLNPENMPMRAHTRSSRPAASTHPLTQRQQSSMIDAQLPQNYLLPIRHRPLFLIGLCLTSMMVGFDLMALLALHMR